MIPAKFLIAVEGHEPDPAHYQDLLKANCLAQSEARLRGRGLDQALERASKTWFCGEPMRWSTGSSS